MDVAALTDAVRDDRDVERRPFCVVASSGVVSTGVIDPLQPIADLCEQERLWFHIDGSLGGFGILDPRRRARFAGLERADSLTLDPHKWLSVPIDCAVVLTPNLDDFRDTFSLVPPYLRARPGDEPWFSEYVLDQTRPFRALKLWATIAGIGRAELTRRVRRNIDHADRLAEQIRATLELELAAEPELNIVAFRHRAGDEDLNSARSRFSRPTKSSSSAHASTNGKPCVPASCTTAPPTTTSTRSSPPYCALQRTSVRPDRADGSSGCESTGRQPTSLGSCRRTFPPTAIEATHPRRHHGHQRPGAIAVAAVSVTERRRPARGFP